MYGIVNRNAKMVSGCPYIMSGLNRYPYIMYGIVNIPVHNKRDSPNYGPVWETNYVANYVQLRLNYEIPGHQ
jgi:hypothetical protein